MQIRIKVPVLMYGSVQLLRGQKLTVPEELALAWVENEEADLVPFAEQATMPRPENASLPRPTSKPKPPAAPRKP